MTGLMVGVLARGDMMRDLKGLTGLSDSGICVRRRQMSDPLLEHCGADCFESCIADVGRDPAWMADLIAEHEAEASQHRPMFDAL